LKKVILLFVLIVLAGCGSIEPADVSESDPIIDDDGVQVLAPGEGTISLNIALPKGYHVNDSGPFTASWTVEGDALIIAEGQAEQKIVAPDFPLDVPVSLSVGEGSVSVDMRVLYCMEEVQCFMHKAQMSVPYRVKEGAGSNDLLVHVDVPKPHQ
jgi:hypothetical protein